METSKAQTIWKCIQDALRGIDFAKVESFDDYVTIVVHTVVEQHGHAREDVQWCWLRQALVLQAETRTENAVDLRMTAKVSALLGKPVVATAHRLELPQGFAIGWAFQPEIGPEELERVKAHIERTDRMASAVVVADDERPLKTLH